MCLAQRHNTVTLVRLADPATSGSRVKPSITEPLCSHGEFERDRVVKDTAAGELIPDPFNCQYFRNLLMEQAGIEHAPMEVYKRTSPSLTVNKKPRM